MNEKHTPTPISAARLDELHADQELRAGLAMPNKEPRRWYADMTSALNELRAQRNSHDALVAALGVK